MFIRPSTLSVSNYLLTHGDNTSSGEWTLNIDASNNLVWTGGSGGAITYSTPGFTTNNWWYVCVERYGGVTSLYAGTTGSLSAGASASDTRVYENNGDTHRIGRSSSATGYFNGHMDEIRISHKAIYKGTVVVPSAALTADNKTGMLCHFEGTDGLTTFTGNAGDVSGSGSGTPATYADDIGSNDLTTANSPVQTIGKQGNAADFELSSNQYAAITDGSQTGLDIDRDMTMMSWFKPETHAANFVTMGKGTTSVGYLMHHTSSGTVTEVFIGGVANTASGTTITDGVWRHEVGIYTGSAVEAYINGTEESSSASTTDPAGTTEDFRIGEEADGTDNSDGVIDEVLVATRWFRPEEVKTAYVNGLNDQDITFQPVSGNTGGFFAIF
jgi:hypothetical protein